MPKSFEKTVLVLLLLLAFLLLVSFGNPLPKYISGFFYLLVESHQKVDQAGVNDFVEYWSAAQLLKEGKNPYDVTTMADFQREELGMSYATMMWNPPWFVLVSSPVLNLKLLSSARIWFFANLLFVFLAGVFIWRALVVERENSDVSFSGKSFFYGSLSLLIFAPLWVNLYYGQLGALLALIVAGLMWALAVENLVVAAIFLVVLTVKPHLFLLIAVLILWWMASTQKMKMLFYCGLFFGVLVAVTEIVYPASVANWLNSFALKDGAGAPMPHQWIGATLIGSLQGYFPQVFAGFHPLLRFLFCLCAALCLLLWLIRRRPPILWHKLFPPTLCLTLIFAPLAWFFDFSVLLVVGYCIVGNSLVGGKVDWLILSLLFLIQSVTFVLIGEARVYHYQFYWYPFVILGLWWWSWRRSLTRRTSYKGRSGPFHGPVWE